MECEIRIRQETVFVLDRQPPGWGFVEAGHRVLAISSLSEELWASRSLILA